MAGRLNFLSKTVKGGIFFLIPIAIIIVLFGKLVNLLRPLANYISRLVDPDDNATFDMSYLISIVILILICFLCGLLAGTGITRSIARWFENNILSIVPGYQYLKNTAKAAMGMESQNYPVVLAPVDGWMIAFVIESLPNNEIVVFVPGAPSPWSGGVYVFDRKSVRPTSLTQREAIAILRHAGVGFKDLKETTA